MSVNNKINALDEALKILWLESIPKVGEKECAKEVELILAEGIDINMDAEKQKQLINKLFGTISGVSLGELISQAIVAQNIEVSNLAVETGLTLNSIADLKQDAVFPNNIPVLLLDRFFQRLHISIESVKDSIWKTFEILQRKEIVDNSPGLIFARKGRGGMLENLINKKMSGRELYENKEALEKYLVKLEELMNKNKNNGS
ncbi:MAG: hypothetical protein ABJA78_16525 [Ferruginibacter sp.]